MRTPRYLPGVRNGVVAKRQGRSKNPATSKAFSGGTGVHRNSSLNSRRISNRVGDRRPIHNRGEHGEGAGRGARVMWLMILTGMALAAGFVFALRSQNNAYKIALAEEELKKKLDNYSNQQHFLSLDKQRALSASESERAGKERGLTYLKLDREEPQREVLVQRLVSRSSVRETHADQNRRLGDRIVA